MSAFNIEKSDLADLGERGERVDSKVTQGGGV